MDYFEQPELLPSKISLIIGDFMAREDAESYSWCAGFLATLQTSGWTFEYGLDGVPYELRPIEVKQHE